MNAESQTSFSLKLQESLGLMPTNPGPHQSMKLVLLNHFGETVALLLSESSFKKKQTNPRNLPYQAWQPF